MLLSRNTFSVALLLLFNIAFAQQRTTITTCNANNCLRQVRATRFPSRPTEQDCARYQLVTATETATVVLIVNPTVTLTVTPASDEAPQRRQITPAAAPPLQPRQASPAIPAYASNCNAPGYASACSCIGVAASTTTTTSITRVTSTATSTTFTTTIVAGPSPICGYLQVTGYEVFPGEPDFNGRYIAVQGDVGGVGPVAQSEAEAQLFRYFNNGFFDPAPGSEVALNVDELPPNSAFFFDDQYSSSFVIADCVFTAGNLVQCGRSRGGERGRFRLDAGNDYLLFYTTDVDTDVTQLRFVRAACPA